MFHFTRCSKIKVTCPAVALLKVSMTACASHNCHCAIAVHTGQTPTNKYDINGWDDQSLNTEKYA